MNFQVRFAAPVLALLAATSVHAISFDDIKKGIEAARQVQQLQPAAQQAAAQKPQANAADLIEPFGLIAYPRATLHKRYINPLEQLTMPATVPEPLNGEHVARYSVPMEGKVTALQYDHLATESPLLIVRHYDGILKSQGFEALPLCQAPCKALQSHWDWRASVDPTKSLDSNYIPKSPTATLYHRDGALVLVSVGVFIDRYATLVKVVEGRIVDRKPLDAAIARLKALEAAAAAQAEAPPAEAAAPLPKLGSNIEVVAGSALDEVIAKTKGVAIVHLTSLDRACGYCVRSNPDFESIARNRATTGRFLRAQWSPWRSAFNEDFLKNYNVTGLPVFIVFKDGRLVRRVDGSVSLQELDKKLTQGL